MNGRSQKRKLPLIESPYPKDIATENGRLITTFKNVTDILYHMNVHSLKDDGHRTQTMNNFKTDSLINHEK